MQSSRKLPNDILLIKSIYILCFLIQKPKSENNGIMQIDLWIRISMSLNQFVPEINSYIGRITYEL